MEYHELKSRIAYYSKTLEQENFVKFIHLLEKDNKMSLNMWFKIKKICNYKIKKFYTASELENRII